MVAAVAVIIAVLLMPVLQISGNSMEDTLSDGDLVIALNNGKFKTGEVIGFYFNNGILVKRVIATSGDWVDIDSEGTVYVNGNALSWVTTARTASTAVRRRSAASPATRSSASSSCASGR